MQKRSHFTNNDGLATLVIILILTFGTACQNTKVHSGTSIEGTVVNASGTPISGMLIETAGQKVETDDQGRFRFNGIPGASVVVKLHGESGTGRYKLDPGTTSANLQLKYPVITEIILLHDNDLHFNYNHRELFEAQVMEIREKYDNVWLLNAGDTFVRHVHRWAAVEDTSYYVEESRKIIMTMNEVGYDASAPGNHELHMIGEHTGQSLRMAEFPLLAANVIIATRLMPKMQPYVIFETTNGMTVAVLGLTRGPGQPGISFHNEIETTRNYLNLADENDLFVALTHRGLANDKELAMEVPELDVIVGGHSHTLLEEAITVNGVLIGHAGGPPAQHQVDPEWPKYLGKMRIVFENDKIVEKTGHVRVIDGYEY